MMSNNEEAPLRSCTIIPMNEAPSAASHAGSCLVVPSLCPVSGQWCVLGGASLVLGEFVKHLSCGLGVKDSCATLSPSGLVWRPLGSCTACMRDSIALIFENLLLASALVPICHGFDMPGHACWALSLLCCAALLALSCGLLHDWSPDRCPEHLP